MQAARVLIFIVGMSASSTAIAGFVSWKEPARQCIGPYQAYLFSWLDDPHECNVYRQQYLRYPQGWITNSESGDAGGCVYVGTGMPFGGWITVWKTKGIQCAFSPSKDSNWVEFYQNDDCDEIP
jgi:hypothetical protein